MLKNSKICLLLKFFIIIIIIIIIIIVIIIIIGYKLLYYLYWEGQRVSVKMIFTLIKLDMQLFCSQSNRFGSQRSLSRWLSFEWENSNNIATF